MVRGSRRSELHRALAEDEPVLHYQPVVSLAGTEVRGVEALIRWQHPVDGLLMPDDFIPAVEHTSTMAGVTRWVLRKACAEAARWPAWVVSVNIAAGDLAEKSFADDVMEALDTAGVAADRLVLELTETALVRDLPRAATTLGYLRDRGVGVALDDFGTGYSSLRYLRDLPVTSVKIDREFVSGLYAARNDRAIVSSLVTLAHRVGVSVVAEGVETALQARILQLMGCPLGQGYLWSRPLTGDEAEAVYRNGLLGGGGAPSNDALQRVLDLDADDRAQRLHRRGLSRLQALRV